MPEKTKISLDIDNELLELVERVKNNSPIKNRAHHLQLLIKDGLELREKVKEQERFIELVSLKTLFFMRQLVLSRGESVLREMDNKFAEELQDMKQMILQNGIDYERS